MRKVVEQMSAMYIALPKLLLNQAAPVAILQRKTAAVVHFSQIRLSVTHWGQAAFAFGTSLASCKTLAPEYGLSIDPYLGV